MDLKQQPRKWSFFDNLQIPRILIFALLIQLISAYILDDLSSTFKKDQNTTILHQSFRLSESFKNQMKNLKNELDQYSISLQQPPHRRKRATFSPPKSDNKFTSIENQISKLHQDLELLKKSTSLNTEDRSGIAALETSVSNFRTTLDNNKQELLQALNSKDDKMQNFTQLLNSFRRELDDMRKTADEREAQDAKRRLYDDIVRDLRSHQFSSAEQRLQKADDAAYKYTVKKVYDHQAGNFELLLTFAEYIPILKRQFKIYDALYYEMRTSGHEDARKLLQLRQSLKKEILDRSTGAIAAKSLFDTLTNALKEAAIAPISAAFLNDNSWPMVKQLSAEINDHCYECLGHIYDKVIDNVWDSLGIQNLLSKAHENLKYIKERILIYKAIINKLERSGAVYTSAAIPLARYMNLTMYDSNYKNMDQDRKSEYEYIKSKLPQTVKNLTFSSSICIKNTAYNEYLFPSTSIEYKEDRRYVFTWVPGDIDEPPKFKWTVSFANDDQIHLKNVGLNEYLVAGNFTHDSQRRNVFTCPPGGSVADVLWNIEVDGDKVHIKNNAHGEYLFADYDRKQQEYWRHVFTYIPGQKTFDSKWEIVDCSNL